VSEAISKGDVNAINYFIAQKYVEAFGDLARSPNAKTVIVPADFAGLTGTVAGVAELVKTLGGNETARPAVPPTPKRGG
jgi:regulator of protease activity HflC (stomatin/prohibitin superfamily)